MLQVNQLKCYLISPMSAWFCQSRVRVSKQNWRDNAHTNVQKQSTRNSLQAAWHVHVKITAGENLTNNKKIHKIITKFDLFSYSLYVLYIYLPMLCSSSSWRFVYKSQFKSVFSMKFLKRAGQKPRWRNFSLELYRKGRGAL
jgi:hypothetical protein